ncbi:ATP-binding protein [Bacillus sp. JJ722]|uniref:ATP-binding protein n=1 Tax=Bacillus sp. JJ722 TaxID=3122973 RepID=UPI002FFF2ACF
MNKKKALAIVILFICILLSLRFSWIFLFQKSDYPEIKDGVLDLREIPFPENETISLNGEWEFYQLLEPTDIKNSLNNMPSDLVKVPERNNSTIVQNTDSSDREGTYRLRILLNQQSEQPYSFNFRDVKSVSAIYINGKKVEELNNKFNDENYSKLNYRPYEVLTAGNVSEIELLIQISDDQSIQSSGIMKSIDFGTYGAMKKKRLFSFSMEILSIGVLFFHGVYVLIIFGLFVRKKELLYLAMAFFCTTLTVLVDDDKLIFSFIPSLSYEWWKILSYLSYSGAVFFLLQFIQFILKEFETKKTSFILSHYIFCALYVLFILSVITQPFMQYNDLLYTVVIIFAAILFIKSLYKGFSLKQIDMYILLAIISVTISTLGGIVKDSLNLDYPHYPIDQIISIMLFSTFWFKKFFQTTKESKEIAIELQRIDKTRDEFLANTSHELRNPLHGIINITQTILETEKDNLSKDNKRNLQLLAKVGRRMSLILNDLLDITRLKKGSIQLQIESVNVLSVVSSVLDMLRFMTEGKNITFEVKIPKTFPNVKADENRLFQILFNLLHNAMKYTNEGKIKIFAETEDGIAIIRVQDTGIGMNQEALQTIFKPYEQIDSSMTAIAGGIGLGLSICEQLVKLHGSTLSVKSSVNIGSTFAFTLPINENHEDVTDFEPIPTPLPRKEENRLSKNPMSKNKALSSIIVVDDDPMNLSILESILGSEPYNVVTCTSGQEALHLLNTRTWDLIITDVMMPNMSGYELTQKVRERYSLTELPILLLTARSQIEDIQAGFYYGANDYVTKPVEQLELKARVKVLTDLKKSVKDRIRMEAAWLQAQIQPHFIFNTLNTIAALSEVNPPKMMELIDEFGNYLHACFDSQNLNQVIPLDQEIKIVRSYVFIQQQRHSERLTVEWEIDKHISVNIPPLTIQTLVENAIMHGILKRSNGGTVHIQISEIQGEVRISIIDNGVGISKQKLQRLLTNQQNNSDQGIGLLNTDKRLKQLYGRGLDISSIQNIGTTVRFYIPKE